MPRFSSLQTLTCYFLIIWSTSYVYVQLSLTKHSYYRRSLDQQKEIGAGRPTPIALEVHCENFRIAIKEGDRRCLKRYNWVQTNHLHHECFSEHGLPSDNQASPCQVITYLYKVEELCSSSLPLDFRSKLDHEKDVESLQEHAHKPKSWRELYEKLDECGFVCKWVKDRIQQHEQKWIAAYDSLNAKRTTEKRKKRRILLHMGLLTKEWGLNFGESSYSGGPLGELVQWSDLIASLFITGHELKLSWSRERLSSIVRPDWKDCKIGTVADIMYTDLYGLNQLENSLNSLEKLKCRLRILDVYGTEPAYNHKFYAKKKGLEETSWGSKHLWPGQFLTQWPHTPDNSFAGFVVNKPEPELLRNADRDAKKALLYGKHEAIFKAKQYNFLDLLSRLSRWNS